MVVIVSYVTKTTFCFVGPKDNNSQGKKNAEKYGVQVYTVKEFENYLNRKHELSDPSSEDEVSDLSEDEDQTCNTPKKKVSILSPSNVIPKSRVVIEHVTTTTPAKQNVTSCDPIKTNYTLNSNTVVESCLDMKSNFINREEVSIELAKLLIQQKEDAKGILPILSQHFGSGKTALVLHFRNVLKKQNYIHNSRSPETFDYLMKSAAIRIHVPYFFMVEMEFEKQLNTNGDFFTKLLEVISESLNMIDRTDLSSEYITKLDTSINVVNSLIKKQLDDALSSQFQDVTTFTTFLDKWSRCKLFPLLLFFDETTMLTEEQILLLWKRITSLFGCDEFTKTVRAPGIYFVFAGKSAILTKLGIGVHII